MWRERAVAQREEQDAIMLDAELKRSKRLATLAAFDGGKQTLEQFAQEWARLHAAHLERKTREL
jgi:hypothetical protein